MSRGVIKYYKYDVDLNQGTRELGRLILVGAQIGTSAGFDKYIIHIIASNEKKDIKLDVLTKPWYNRWLRAIQKHIGYADANKDFILDM